MHRLDSLDYLIERIWDELRLVKIYTKKRGAHPDLADPVCLRAGATVEVTFLPAEWPQYTDDYTNRMYVMESINLLLPTSATGLSGTSLNISA